LHIVTKCHQRIIREREEVEEASGLFGKWWEGRNLSPALAAVREIAREQAEPLITKYEWLGTLPANYFFYAGLFIGDDLAGVSCFTRVKFGGKFSLLGRPAICLGRGACAFWTPPWSGSFLVSRACRLVAKQFNEPTYFVAFSDWSAGEIGTIYQACNWTYLGHSQTKEYRGPNNERLDINTPRVRAVSGFQRRENPELRATKEQVKHEHGLLLAAGYRIVSGPNRGKYAAVYGRNGAQKNKMVKELTAVARPYPKREASEVSIATRQATSLQGMVTIP
jgi:hypothetical protein